MKRLTINAAIAKALLYMLLTAACTRAEAVENIPAGTEVTVVTQDGTLVRGKIAKVDADVVTLNGERPNTSTEITRTSIAEVKRVSNEREADAAAAPIVRTITIPDNTVLDVTLNTALASDTSRVEERVNGTVASPVVIDGTTVIPSGAALSGHVTHVDDSDKIKGRAELSFRFTRLRTGSVTYDIDTKPLYYVAEGTKKEDAVKIGVGAAAGAIVGAITGGKKGAAIGTAVGAAAGAVIGAIAGGKKGAAIGTAVGAGAGAGVVLATDGKEIRLAEGRKLKVSLNNPLTIRTK